MDRFTVLQVEAMRLHSLRDQLHPCSAEWREVDHMILALYTEQAECRASVPSGMIVFTAEA
jgi:hypothetical protein